jgi:GAF domain-containing protein
MSTHPSLDCESFQKLLASAFSVQESGMDAQSLSALLELQQSIATGEPEVDRAMHLVADRARNVANATGIAIALRRRDQLVYRAGSGCAASYVGRHMTAILSVSGHNGAKGEILRVENAQADGRIEAAICRQLEAQSLLILPIYDEGAVAGVLEVLFSEPHAFQEREMRTYRLMAGLVGEAMSRDAQLDQKKALATQAANLPHAIEQVASQMQRSRGDDKSTPWPARKHGIRQVCGAATAVAGELPGVCQPAKAATIIMQRVKRVPLHKLRWNVAVTGVVTALVIAACWIAYARRPASPAGTPSLQRSNAVQQQIPFVPAKPAPSNRASKAQTAAGGAEEAKSPSSAFKRVRVGPNETDYIAEDVTIRHFTTKPALPRVRGGFKEVHIGEDVTVRYFASKLAVVSQTRTASTAAQSLDRSLPVSK